jgi:hypothetical protein
MNKCLRGTIRQLSARFSRCHPFDTLRVTVVMTAFDGGNEKGRVLAEPAFFVFALVAGSR